MALVNSLIRILFVLSVVSFSIYFLSTPSNNVNINQPPTLSSYEAEIKRQQDLEAAIEETRIEINDSLKQFSFPSSIPGSNIKTRKHLLEFRKRMDCITTRGKWVYDDTPRPILKHKQELIFGKCDKNSIPLNKNASIEEIWENARNSVKYKWETPYECPLPSFTRQEFCSLITDSSMLLVGDLLSYQLHDLLLNYFHDGPVQCYGETSCKDHILCPLPPSNKHHNNLSSAM